MAFFTRRGEPAPRESYCRLYVNDVFQGLYSIVESVDADFLARTSDSDQGYLPASTTSASGTVRISARTSPSNMGVTDERRGQSVDDTDLFPAVAAGWYVSGTWAVTGEAKAKGLDAPPPGRSFGAAPALLK